MAKGKEAAKTESDIDKAKRLINEEKDKRSNICLSEIEEILKKHNCQLIVSGQFSANNIQTNINIIAND